MITSSCHDPDVEFPRGSESEVLSELISYLQWLGLDDPTHQVYSPSNRWIRLIIRKFVHNLHLIWLSNRTPPRVEYLLTLMTLSNLSRMVFSTSTGFLVSKKLTEVDGWVFLSGLSLLMLQYSPQVWIMNSWWMESLSSFVLQGPWGRCPAAAAGRELLHLEQRQLGSVQRDAV